MLQNTKHIDEPTTILVLRYSSAGDVLLISPVLSALGAAWPQARIVVVTKSQYVDLVRSHPQVAAVEPVLPNENILKLYFRLRALKPTAILDLHGKLRGMVLRRLVPRQNRALLHKRPWHQSLAVRLRFKRYHNKQLIVERYHAALEQLLGHKVSPGVLHHVATTEHLAKVSESLVAAGVDLTKPICGISPGSQWPTKCWPIEYYGELAARLTNNDGLQVVLVGSQKEVQLTKAIKSRAPAAIDLGGYFNLCELAAFISKCRLFIANDSGPMHMARAQGVATVAIFGSTDPGLFDFTGHTALSLNLDCAPCSLYGRKRCPLGHFRCMRELDVDRVYDAVQKIFAKALPALVRG
ncbi:MAG: glycosyltransferase family 9 protein [Deltaproteobacteria bacterium]|nr:glycosyltransferase family 9 protein [Deltaproteobacteria bacterium]